MGAMVIKPISELADDRDLWASLAPPQTRLEYALEFATRLRSKLLDTSRATFYQSLDLRRVPYPTRYGLRDATTVRTPLVHILNRMFIVQTRSDEGLKTILVSPSDVVANEETPFFKNLAARVPAALRQTLAPTIREVTDALRETGIAPEDVDFITYDHLHTQDLRRWLGDTKTPGLLPNAKLLVMKREWKNAQGLLPYQAQWYCPGGCDHIPADRVVELDGSVQVGESVALIETPGHTEGNHSIAVHTDEGLMVTSENGISADSYAPKHSKIPGLRAFAQQTGAAVVMNANTLERSNDQYISMMLERSLAGPSVRDERFFNTVPSSELTPYWLFPGVRPTLSFGELRFGEPTLARGAES